MSTEKIAPLSVKPPSFIGGDEEAKNEYFGALNKALASLERRQGFNLFNVAGAFLNPGRTGSFGEALGNAASTAGRDVERDEAREIPLAQMRASLAGQKYESEKQSQALNMLGKVLGGVSGGDAVSSLSEQNIFNPSITQRLMRAYPMLARDPKTGEIVKTMITQGIDMQKLVLQERAAGTDEATLVAKYGPSVLPLLQQQQGSTGARTTSTPSGQTGTQRTSQPSATTSDSATPNTLGAPSGKTDEEMDDQRGRGDTPPKPNNVSTAGAPQFGVEQTSPNTYKLTYSGRELTVPPGMALERVNDYIAKALETEQSIYKGSVDAENKPFQEKTAELLKFDNQATASNLSRTDSILTLIQKNPNITGILQSDQASAVGKWLNALGAAAQEGLQAGTFGSFSIPVEKFVTTKNMTQQQKEALGELSRLINMEFLAGMKANRGVLGVNPTDNDARLFQAAAANPSNLSANIYSWAQGRGAEYETMNDMYRAYGKFRNQNGVGDPAAFYLSEISPYHNVIQRYTKRLGTVMQNAPGMR